jgi:hypothetical protein
VADGRKKKKVRKAYEKPTATQLAPEQAKQKLLGLVKRRDQEARKLLEMMFPEEAQKDSSNKKKSA